MISITRRDKWKNIRIRETTGVIDIINHIKKIQIEMGRSYSKAKTKMMDTTVWTPRYGH